MKGKVRIGEKTKELLPRLKPGDFVMVKHCNMDETICQDLIRARIRGVLNTEPIMTADYPNRGPLLLAREGITLVEGIEPSVFGAVAEGSVIKLVGGEIFHNGRSLGCGHKLDREELVQRLHESRSGVQAKLSQFLDNTLIRARAEKDIIFDRAIPPLEVSMAKRPALVVVRGKDYLEDLTAIFPFIKEEKPVIIAVDGGADGCLKLGIRPDIIIGDMDSVSDGALRKGKEIIVHAYPDGRAPGAARIETLGLPYKLFPALGTSEDIAMILAYEAGADMIVAVGTHSNLTDFLAKGRPGMASTLLVRLKLGSMLVDAKGVGRLYRRKIEGRDIACLVFAVLFPVGIALYLSPLFRPFLNVAFMKLRLLLHF